MVVPNSCVKRCRIRSPRRWTISGRSLTVFHKFLRELARIRKRRSRIWTGIGSTKVCLTVPNRSIDVETKEAKSG